MKFILFSLPDVIIELIILVVTLVYFVIPKRLWRGEKNDYVKFVLASLSLFVIIDWFADDFQLWSLMCLLATSILHQIYPFKSPRRNQHVSFFLITTTGIVYGLLFLLWCAHFVGTLKQPM